jgi:hypothetical protein
MNSGRCLPGRTCVANRCGVDCAQEYFGCAKVRKNASTVAPLLSVLASTLALVSHAEGGSPRHRRHRPPVYTSAYSQDDATSR